MPAETLEEAIQATRDAGYSVLRDGAQHETTTAWDEKRTVHVVNVEPGE